MTGASDVGEVISGNNVIRDDILGGNQDSYDTLKLGLYIAGGVAMALGAMDRTKGVGNANQQLANKVANKYGGSVRIADNGKGYVVKTNNITTRVMDSGGGRTNYYKISNQGKGSFDRFGNYTSDLSKNHIDIGPNSYDEIINIIDEFVKR